MQCETQWVFHYHPVSYHLKQKKSKTEENKDWQRQWVDCKFIHKDSDTQMRPMWIASQVFRWAVTLRSYPIIDMFLGKIMK